MTAAELAPILQIVAAVVALKVIDLAVKRVWNRTVETEYMTVNACNSCRSECRSGRQVKDEDLIKLVRSLREEVRQLRLLIVKNMLYQKAPPSAIEEALESKVGGSN